MRRNSTTRRSSELLCAARNSRKQLEGKLGAAQDEIDRGRVARKKAHCPRSAKKSNDGDAAGCNEQRGLGEHVGDRGRSICAEQLCALRWRAVL